METRQTVVMSAEIFLNTIEAIYVPMCLEHGGVYLTSTPS